MPVLHRLYGRGVHFGALGSRGSQGSDIVGLFLARRGELPNPWPLAAQLRVLLLVSILGITLNYTLFVVGVRLTSPATAQIVTQLANLFLLLGGLLVFRERFSGLQWLGVAVLVAGLTLFFNRRLLLLFDGGAPLGWGVLLLTLGALLLTPLVHPAHLRRLTMGQGYALLFCSCNTLIAYGAYAEAMKLGEVARVSATVTISPLFTLLGGAVAAIWWPALVAAEPTHLLALLGACAVVAGSALCALGSTPARARAHSG